ncbi:MAG TPA: arsenate reductase ArsC [bacterium]|nr:arsenate reductase ArsC [bacterium]HQG45056.1 arsenate reductase ArsC [bacterium]HQI48731.1 arsenate reductase ArsC [bacterium]HQJ63050.1 arsenate reductase ArsC [bacterium]
MRILILCTGNSCRSQMAEAFLKHFNPAMEVYSAGTDPAAAVHPLAVRVMAEKHIDISTARPKPVLLFTHLPFHYVITVCDNARENCPVFLGEVKEQVHLGFADPAAVTGSEEQQLTAFRTIRDEIYQAFKQFYLEKIVRPDPLMNN